MQASSESSQTVDTRTFTIGVLSVTATVLFVGLMMLMMQPPTANAIGMNDRGGDYIMCTQQLTTSQEGLLVIDAAAERMILYAYDFNQRRMQMFDGFELNRLLKRPPPAVKDQGTRRR